MKAFKHVGYTWLLAQLIHPLIFYCFTLLNSGWEVDIGSLLSFFIGSFLISLPAFILCLLFINIVPVLKISVTGNFIIWLALASTSIFINVVLLILLLGDTRLFLTEWDLFFPSLIAAIVSILIRYRQFGGYVMATIPNYYREANSYTMD